MINKDITVGIPFYSKTSVDEFVLAVDSILKQSHSPSVIHFIQDGPIGKELKSVVDNYLLKHSSIVYIKLDKVNLAVALNKSIKKTKTKYYARMDSDDISMPDRLMLQSKFLDENSNISIVGSWATEFYQDVSNSDNFIKKVPFIYSEIVSFYHYRNPLIHPTVMFRVSVFDKLGYYNEAFSTDQDLELWGRAIKNDIGISNIQESLLYHNIKGIHKRRTRLRAICNQILARRLLPANSIKLKLLKFAAICFRFMPEIIIKFGYKKLR